LFATTPPRKQIDNLCLHDALPIFWGAADLKLFRNKPYVTITNTYIRLDPQTKSEVTLYYDDIKFIDISEASFQKLIKIFVYDEKTLFKQLSLHNKIRLGPNALFGFKT